MIGTNGVKDDTGLEEADEMSEEESPDIDTAATGELPDIGDDTLVDVTAELRVDELVAKLEATDPDEAAHKREVRKRLEEIREQREKDLDSTFNFNLDDEI